MTSVLPTLTPEEMHLLATGRPGLVPGSVNNRLLGTARATNGGDLLHKHQERELRKRMYEAAMKRYANEI